MTERLLDQSVPVQESDIPVLDELAIRAWRGNNQEALTLVTLFAQREDAFRVACPILTSDQTSVYLKMMALQIFKKFVKERWERCGDEERANFRNFLIGFIMKVITVPEYAAIVNTANQTFVEILKIDWPEKYPNLMPDLLQSAAASEQAHRNCLGILDSLVQEIGEFHDPDLKSSRIAEMLEAFYASAGPVMTMVRDSLGSSSEAVVHAALSCLRAILKAADPAILGLDVDFIQSICTTLLPDQRDTVDCLSVLSELAACGLGHDDMRDPFLDVFHQVVEVLKPVFGEDIYESDASNQTISKFASAINQLLISRSFFDGNQDDPALAQVFKWMMQITMNTTNRDDLSSCIELWNRHTPHHRCIDRYHEPPKCLIELFPTLRRVLIAKMDRPYESMVNVEDSGFASRSTVTGLESTSLHMMMADILCTQVMYDKGDVFAAFSSRMAEIRASTPFDKEGLERMCWACGAIAESLTDGDDRSFLASMISCLAELCRSLQDVDDRAVVAKGLIYICGRYSRVMSKFQDLLKTVMMKMIEFTREQAPGVQDAAVDAINVLASACHTELANRDSGDGPSFLEEMMSNLQAILAPLSSENIIMMYEVLGGLVGSLGNVQQGEAMSSVLIQSVSERLNTLAASPQFNSPEYDKQLIFVLKCHERLSAGLRSIYTTRVLGVLIPQLTELYKAAVGHFSRLMASGRANIEEATAVKHVKAAILSLIKQASVSMSVQACDILLPVSFDVFMQEYASNEAGRVPEVLLLFCQIMSRFGQAVEKALPLIFQSLIKTTGAMISSGFTELREFRIAMNSLTGSFILRGLIILTELSKEDVVFFVECIKWNCKHPEGAVSERAVQNMIDLLTSVNGPLPARITQEFYDCFLLPILDLALELLTDSIHKFLLTSVTCLLKHIMSVLATQDKTKEVVELFCTRFPRRSPMEHFQVIEAMFKASNNYFEFKGLVTSFLIDVKKFSPKDPALAAMERAEIEKLLEERKTATEQVSEEEAKAAEMAGNLAAFINNFKF